MYQLAEILSIELFAAHGLLEMLWHYAGDYAAQGDIGKVPDQRISIGVHWRGDPLTLISALVDSRWLDESDDHRLIIHDWPDHAQDWVRKKLRRAHLDWLPIYGKTLYSVSEDVSRQHGVSEDVSRQVGTSRDKSGQVRTNSPSSRKGREGELRGGSSIPKTEVLERKDPPSQNGNGIHPEWKRDKTIAPLVEAYAATGKPLTDWDWGEAWFEWRVLDFEQKLLAISGIRARIDAGLCSEVEFVMLPKNYLKKREWTREIETRKTGGLPGHMNPGLVD